MKIVVVEEKKKKFNKRKTMTTTLERIIKDSTNIKDYLIPVKQLMVDSGIHNQAMPAIPHIYFETGKESPISNTEYLRIHDNAITQIGQKFNIPSQYLSKLHTGKEWEKVLFAKTLSDHFDFSTRQNDNVLVRINDGVLKAFVSDKFERYNSASVLATFVQKMAENGFKIAQSYYDGISYFVEFADKEHPVMINGQEHWFGVQYRNSDFGQSALDIKLMLVKKICSNGMTMKTVMRQIHKGKTLGFDAKDFQLSKRTLDLEGELKTSIINDIIPQIVSPEAKANLVDAFLKVDKLDIPVDTVIKQLPSVVTKSDIENIQKILMENSEESGVRDCGNVLRVANAISYLANGLDEEKAISKAKYKDIAGQVIMKYVTLN